MIVRKIAKKYITQSGLPSYKVMQKNNLIMAPLLKVNFSEEKKPSERSQENDKKGVKKHLDSLDYPKLKEDLEKGKKGSYMGKYFSKLASMSRLNESYRMNKLNKLSLWIRRPAIPKTSQNNFFTSHFPLFVMFMSTAFIFSYFFFGFGDKWKILSQK